MYRSILLSILAMACTLSVSGQTDSIRTDDGRIFNKVEREAEFPGGISAWTDYLMKNLRADVPAKKGAPAGSYTVIVKFIVARDGNIFEVMAETSHGYGMENEVIRIIKKGPRWNPALVNGKPVSAYRRQPVTFVLEEK